MEGKRRTGGMNRFSGISPVFLFFYPPPNPLPFLSFLFLSASKKNSGTGSGLVCPKQSSVWFASFGPDSSFFPLPTLSPSFLLSLSLSLSLTILFFLPCGSSSPFYPFSIFYLCLLCWLDCLADPPDIPSSSFSRRPSSFFFTSRPSNHGPLKP